MNVDDLIEAIDVRFGRVKVSINGVERDISHIESSGGIVYLIGEDLPTEWELSCPVGAGEGD